MSIHIEIFTEALKSLLSQLFLVDSSIHSGSLRSSMNKIDFK